MNHIAVMSYIPLGYVLDVFMDHRCGKRVKLIFFGRSIIHNFYATDVTMPLEQPQMTQNKHRREPVFEHVLLTASKPDASCRRS